MPTCALPPSGTYARSLTTLILAALLAEGCGESPLTEPSEPAVGGRSTPGSPEAPPRTDDGFVIDHAVGSITRLGGTQHLTARVRNEMIDPSQVDWATLDPAAASVDETGTVTGLATGVARIVGAHGGTRDTVRVSVAPVVASIERVRDTLVVSVDSAQPLPFLVRDSGGATLPPTALSVRSVGSAEIAVASDGSVVGLLPGRGSLLVAAGELSDSVSLSVRGVVVLANGQRVATTGSLLGANEIVIRNGRVRLTWGSSVTLRAGFDMAVWMGDAWVPATVTGAADWLYIASNVITEPTAIDLLMVSDSVVALRMRMGAHWFLPQDVGYPLSYVSEPHPFSRTIWLKRGDWGYYSWVNLEESLNYSGIEHEIGFGGLWGPGEIRSADASFRTESLQNTFRFNLDWSLDAAEFLRDGDPLRRVLVPLPGAPLISPVFPGWGYGSVYVHRNNDSSYGAFMFAAPTSVALAAREICRRAWREAPFALPAVSDAELGGCGPD